MEHIGHNHQLTTILANLAHVTPMRGEAFISLLASSAYDEEVGDDGDDVGDADHDGDVGDDGDGGKDGADNDQTIGFSIISTFLDIYSLFATYYG